MDISENKKTLIALVVVLGALIVLVLVMSGTENGKYQMIADPCGTRVLILNTHNAELTACQIDFLKFMDAKIKGNFCITKPMRTDMLEGYVK